MGYPLKLATEGQREFYDHPGTRFTHKHKRVELKFSGGFVIL